jgi:hypothetical protein
VSSKELNKTSSNEQLDEENRDWSRCGGSTACSRQPRRKFVSTLRVFDKQGTFCPERRPTSVAIKPESVVKNLLDDGIGRHPRATAQAIFPSAAQFACLEDTFHQSNRSRAAAGDHDKPLPTDWWLFLTASASRPRSV